MSLPVYIDIDGTLTDYGNQGGNPLHKRIAHVRRLITDGVEVVLWSGGGTEYAKRFAVEHGLMCVCLGKPGTVIDDNPTIRPLGRIKAIRPKDFFP